MRVSQNLLNRLRCPESRQLLSKASPNQLEAINARLEMPLEDALVREDGHRAYPIRDGFPILLIDEAIEL